MGLERVWLVKTTGYDYHWVMRYELLHSNIYDKHRPNFYPNYKIMTWINELYCFLGGGDSTTLVLAENSKWKNNVETFTDLYAFPIRIIFCRKNDFHCKLSSTMILAECINLSSIALSVVFYFITFKWCRSQVDIFNVSNAVG